MRRSPSSVVAVDCVMGFVPFCSLPFPPSPPRLLRQTGLSLRGSLDRAEATAGCPARMPNLLALAGAIRPPPNVFDGTSGTAAERARVAAGFPSLGGSKKRPNKEKAGAVLPWANGGAPIFPFKVAAVEDGGNRETEAPGSKRRRVDVSAILCPFELNGVCNDDDCR